MFNYNMSKSFLLSLFLSVTASAFAQYTSDGYYRVQNVTTERYIVVLDDRGSFDLSTTDPDLNALRTYKGFENVVANPASIIYVQKKSDGYILYSQGTDTYSIVSVYLKLYDNKDGTYKAYATDSGMTKYLKDAGDANYGDDSVGKLGTGGRTESGSDWYVLPVSSSNESNYFGMKPDCTVDGYHYQTFYASFPFSFVSSGTSAYYVNQIGTAEDGFGMAIWKKLDGESVPASTPIIVKCTSPEYSDNKINLLTSSSVSVSGNMLKGVYFCNAVSNKTHRNVLDYDPETMRVLGITSNGALGFVTATTEDLPYVPANSAYLVVPAGTPSELQLVTEDEYAALLEEHKAVEPEEPDDPGDEVNPDDPGDEVNPDDPGDEVNPDDPGDEVNPDDPGDEVDPDDPDTPDDPDIPAGIEEVTSPAQVVQATPGVYTLMGVKVCDGNTLPSGSPAGIYIIGGKKVVVR